MGPEKNVGPKKMWVPKKMVVPKRIKVPKKIWVLKKMLVLKKYVVGWVGGSEQEQLMFIRLKIIPPLADHPSLWDLMGLSFRAECGNKLDLEMHSLSILA